MITRPLVILGTGRIARALLRQFHARAGHLRDRYKLDVPVAAAINSRFILAGSPYLHPDDVEMIAASGLERGDRNAHNLPGYIEVLAHSLPDRPIIADLTASDAMSAALIAALEHGCDVVLANKKPLTESYETFERLTRHPGGRIGYEATVGASLPLIHTFHTLDAAGDELVDATACLSGTLGYVCTELDEGVPLSRIVPDAREQGFTEPDPRDDLSGADVRRKALILARTMGQRLEMQDVPSAPLVPLDEHLSVADWLAGLTRHDQTLAARTQAAHEQGEVLRYVARISPVGCEVGLRAVPRTSAVGRLRGTDNIITAHTRFYAERPLIVSGPGAGPDVTAAGVFADVLRLACVG